MLAKVREQVAPEMTRRGPIKVWIIDDTAFPRLAGRSNAIAPVVWYSLDLWSTPTDGILKVMLDFQEVIGRVAQRSWPGLVAIDGLPLAGKSTLADRLAVAAGAECIRLDDFVKPEAECDHTINHRSPLISSATTNFW